MAYADGRKSGGRKKGTPNKKVRRADEIAERLGIDPFEILLRFAGGDWKGLGYEEGSKEIVTQSGDAIQVDVIGPELRQKAAKEAAKYIYPQRKAIEVDDKRQSPFEKFLLMSDEERARYRESLRERLKEEDDRNGA